MDTNMLNLATTALEVIQVLAVLALLYFAWKSSKPARVPGLLAGLFLLLNVIVRLFKVSGSGSQLPLATWISLGQWTIYTVALICLAWWAARVKR